MPTLNSDLQINETDLQSLCIPGAGKVAPLWAGLFVAGLLVACAPSRIPAPVETRNLSKVPMTQRGGSNSSSAMGSAAASALSPAPEGFYRVKRGDTLIGISLDHGIAWRDLALWNSIDNPNLIEVDQLLRVSFPNAPKTDIKSIAPSGSSASSAANAKGSSQLQGQMQGRAAEPAQSTEANSQSASAAAVKSAAEGMTFSWPGKGQVMTQFADPGYKGIAISGNEGDPVSAAADGRIVYSGNGLRGYGNLVIIKHDGDFLTAYAHNKSILVNEGQIVKRGQKIAELGKTDSDVPKLHFEVRKSGKPVDPMKFLASR